jgi:hypothetical protein
MTKLCPRGKAAAKRKFKVYPSAYANAYASKICAGKIKDPSGVKRKDFRGSKAEGGPAEDNMLKKLGERKKQQTEKNKKDPFSIFKRKELDQKRRPAMKGPIGKLAKEKPRRGMMGGGLMEATARLKKQGLKGGGISQRGLGRAFMKGGRV